MSQTPSAIRTLASVFVALILLNVLMYDVLPLPRRAVVSSRPRLHSYRLDFGLSSLPAGAGGWRSPERAPDGATFCWTASARAWTVVPPMEPSDYTLEVGVMATTRPSYLDDLRITVNDRPLPLSRRRSGGRTVFTATVTRDDLRAPRVVALLTGPEGGDSRPRLCVSWLSLSPNRGLRCRVGWEGEAWVVSGADLLPSRALALSMQGREQVVLADAAPILVNGDTSPLGLQDGTIRMGTGGPTEVSLKPARPIENATTRVYRPDRLFADVVDVPVTDGWLPPKVDLMGRTYRRLRERSASILLQCALPAEIRFGVLTADDPLVPVFLPRDLFPPSRPTVRLSADGVPIALETQDRPYERIFRGHLPAGLGHGPVTRLTFSREDNEGADLGPALCWIELTGAGAAALVEGR